MKRHKQSYDMALRVTEELRVVVQSRKASVLATLTKWAGG